MPVYSFDSEDAMINAAEHMSETQRPKISKTVHLDLPEKYWEPLRIVGVSRDAENVQAVSAYFSRGLSNAELTALHEFLRSFPIPTQDREDTP